MKKISTIYKSKFDYRVVCDYCNAVLDVEEEEIVLRNVKDTPVNSYTCVECGKRNYFCTSKFTKNLIEEFYNYRKTHPVSIGSQMEA